MKTISLDLRTRIMDAVDKHDATQQQVADRFAVSLGFVKKLVRQRKLVGSIENLHHRAGRKRIVSPEQETRIRDYLKEHPGATLKGIRSAFALPCSLVAVFFTLRRMGFTYKKNPSAPPSRILPESRSNERRGTRKASSGTPSASSSSTNRASRRK